MDAGRRDSSAADIGAVQVILIPEDDHAVNPLANRVSSSRLFDLTRISGVPIAYFYDEMGTDVSQQSHRQINRPGQARPKLIDVPADPVM